MSAITIIGALSIACISFVIGYVRGSEDADKIHESEKNSKQPDPITPERMRAAAETLKSIIPPA